MKLYEYSVWIRVPIVVAAESEDAATEHVKAMSCLGVLNAVGDELPEETEDVDMCDEREMPDGCDPDDLAHVVAKGTE